MQKRNQLNAFGGQCKLFKLILFVFVPINGMAITVIFSYAGLLECGLIAAFALGAVGGVALGFISGWTFTFLDDLMTYAILTGVEAVLIVLPMVVFREALMMVVPAGALLALEMFTLQMVLTGYLLICFGVGILPGLILKALHRKELETAV